MPIRNELLEELNNRKDINGKIIPGLTFDELRTKYIKKLSEYTKRNVICYYSAWLKPGRQNNLDINDSDLTGFMSCVNKLDCSKGLDLILHTPGGYPTATEGIVNYLHSKFTNIRCIVPQMAMSAGTMLACSSNKILMGKHSCLGPIDPQYGNISAYNIVKEFTSAQEDLNKNPQNLTYWQILLNKYPVAFLYSVNDSIRLASQLTQAWLSNYMFKEEPESVKQSKVKKIVSKLNANNKSHSRHFSLDFCKDLGLKIEELEQDQQLQDLVLSVHHAFIITIDGAQVSKIIENQLSTRYVSWSK